MEHLTTKDFTDFNKAQQAVYSLMQDGRWYKAETIIKRSGQREGLRRMRDLRQHPSVVDIESRRPSKNSREWCYRMICA